jgi:signal transduction histidine kinase
MKNRAPQSWTWIDTLVTSLVLLSLLVGVYALLGSAPYIGFYFDPFSGTISETYVEPEAVLQRGDVIEEINGVSWKEYIHNKYLVIFEDAEVYEMTIIRADRKIDLQWRLPGFNAGEFTSRFFSTWWLAFPFWFFGFLTHRYIQPRDLTWRLLVAFNYLLAIFISFGNVSSFHVLGSLVWMRVAVWLLTPVFLHLHWIFPTPLRPLPSWLWKGLYLIFGVLAALEVLPIRFFLPSFLGLLLAFLGAAVLLVIHYIRQPSGRSDIRLPAIVLLFALLPIILFSLIGLDGKTMPAAAPLSIFPLALVPGIYVYVINRRRMGQLELRASRAVSAMAYLALLVSILPFVALLIMNMDWPSQELEAAIALFFSLATALLTIYFFPRFQEFIERRFLGITLPYQKILEVYSTRIPSCMTQADLVKLLEQDVFNSLQVRQYALLAKEGTEYVTLASQEVDVDRLKADEALALLDAHRDYRLLPPSTGSGSPLDWLRLILPLKVESGIVGLWLFGRRDPDDLYPQADLPIIQSLASQTAIALSHIQQSEQVKAMNLANVNRYEQERLRLAQDLHDSVLNELAALMMFLDPAARTPKFQAAYGALVQRVRDIVTNLRPPMLNYGFKPALAELADHLSEIHNDLVQINVAVDGEDDLHYPQNVEHYIYRMVQEACENSIRHGQAGRVNILGRLDETSINLVVEDNGRGFDAASATQPLSLASRKHYGLAGMLERAQLIGAEVRIDSSPKKGARVAIYWKASS